jgi:alpha-1,3-glucosyltransferase
MTTRRPSQHPLNPAPLPHPRQVVHRIFPVKRGLYEDYLANWWCATSVVVKWKAVVDAAALVPLCAALTLLAAAPSMAQQIASPSPQGLLLGMANSAFAFYMFGYQVHEKSILLPLLPITALAAWEPAAALWAPAVAALSMFPLLERDGAALPYAAALAIYAAVMTRLLPRGAAGKAGKGGAAATGWAAAAAKVAAWGGAAAALGLHAARALVPAPERLPWLHDRLFVSLSFVFVAGGMAYFNWRQWNQLDGGRLAGGPAAAGGKAGKASALPATPQPKSKAAASTRSTPLPAVGGRRALTPAKGKVKAV